jgi:hypothetical protein
VLERAQGVTVAVRAAKPQDGDGHSGHLHRVVAPGVAIVVDATVIYASATSTS